MQFQMMNGKALSRNLASIPRTMHGLIGTTVMKESEKNWTSSVTGITATDGSGNVLIDLNFIIPIDLEKPILEQIQEDA